MPLRVDRLDHLVLTVRSLARTCEFYEKVLGMEVVHYGHGRIAVRFGDQRINLHEVGKEFSPKAMRPTPGSGDLCFITRRVLTEWVDHLAASGVPIVEGPVRKTGTLGSMESIYVRDPDENLIEIASYGRSEP